MNKFFKTRHGDTIAMSIAAGLLLVACHAFYWNLVERLTPFLAPLLMLAVWFVFLASAVASLVYLWRNRKAGSIRYCLPLLFHIMAVVLALKVPWTSVMLDLDFKIYLKQREMVVHKIISGDIKPNVSYNDTLILLPKGYRHLSSGGEVVMERDSRATAILFYTFRGILDNFSGFVFRSDGAPPQDDVFGSDPVVIKRIDAHWFWVQAT